MFSRGTNRGSPRVPFARCVNKRQTGQIERFQTGDETIRSVDDVAQSRRRGAG